MVLGHVEIDDKSNAIPTVQQLLADLGLAGNVITLDAYHSQKILELAAERECQFIAQVKANLPTLVDDVQRLCANETPVDWHETTETARSRHEARLAEVFYGGGHFQNSGWAPFISAVIRVERRRLDHNAITGLRNSASEISYYVSNSRNAKRWRGAEMALRWAATGMLEAQKVFHRLKPRRSTCAGHSTMAPLKLL